MTASIPDLHAIVASLLALAVLLGSLRMLGRLRRQDRAMRPRAWRTVSLLLLQAAGAVLLYWVLFPPPVAREAGTLVVLTARADEVAAKEREGDHVVALPEAAASKTKSLGPRLRGDDEQESPQGDAEAEIPRRDGEQDIPRAIERLPDLATALRRYPASKRIRVVGAGLVARDREAVQGRALDFRAAPLPRGLVALQAPGQVPAGRQFLVSGRVEGIPGGSAELIDPSGRRADRAVLDDDGRFRLRASTRTAGLASYRLRLRDARVRVVEDSVVPLETTAPRALRVLLLAGAANAELKYLRRWAIDAGMQLDTRISLGGGLQIGSTPAGLDAASLDKPDLVVFDERSWRALGAGQRAALSAAVERGLGLLLRLDGPVDGTDRQRLRALGFDATGAGAARETRLGEGFVRAGDAADALPTVTRAATRVSASDGVVLLADAAGAPLAVWRAQGRGRIGVSTLDDSWRLVLAGRREAHGEAWSRLFGSLARAGGTRRDVEIGASRQHQRTVVCGIGVRARVVAPSGGPVALRIDPASGPRRCAGLWPEAPGWHVLRDGELAMPFHVDAATGQVGLQAQALREATQALAAGSGAASGALQATQPGPRWPWFLAWMLFATIAWWLERTRLGVPRTPATGP